MLDNVDCSLVSQVSQGKGIGGCRILNSFRDDKYYNISQLGIAAMDNDYESIDFLVKLGCDPNHNDTAMDKYPELEEIKVWVSGITPPHPHLS